MLSNYIYIKVWDKIFHSCLNYNKIGSETAIEGKVRMSNHIPQLRMVNYDDVTMGAMESQITSLTIVYSTVYSDADQRKHESSALLAFVWGIHRGPVNSPHKWPVARKMFPLHDVIMPN